MKTLSAPAATAPAPRPRAPEVTRLDGVPFNLNRWIATRMAGDQGTVGNKEVFRQSDFIFQIIKGPNRRNDYHMDPYDEIFYQLEGTAFVVYRDAEDREQVATLRAGDVLLIAAFTPHSPRRPPDSIGLVVERPRAAHELDGLRWYCEGCGRRLEDLWLPCQDIEVQLKQALDAFNTDLARRTCKHCGAVLPDPTQDPPWRRLLEKYGGAAAHAH